MTLALPGLIALWSGGITVALLLAAAYVAALAKGWRTSETPGRNVRFSQFAGSVILFAIPLSFAVPLASLGSALLIGVRAPALVYLFVTLAALIGVRAASMSNGYGMAGCSKAIGLFAASYVAVWGVVSFLVAGGPAQFSGVGLAWLKPPLAAAPFALLVALLAGRKRTWSTFPTALVLLSAALALVYFPVEAGAGARWLPQSDWLRFPVAGVAIGLILSSLQLLTLLGTSAAARARRARTLPRNILFAALVTAPTGLAWAAARAVTGSF
jgi:hypothetical protein